VKARPRILFYFLHLLGVGHVYRAKRLIEGFARKGMDVDIIYGGLPIGETFMASNVYYLPPIQAESADYKNFLNSDGEPLTEDYMAKRQAQLLDCFDLAAPDLILFEAFPFGRRIVRNEILALIEKSQQRTPQPMIATSVRDILQPRSKAGRNEETRDMVLNKIDKVLVHSDPQVIPLEETYPLLADIEHKVSYTGFVVPETKSQNDVPCFDIIVSAGGGGFGFDLLTCASRVAELAKWKHLSWCLSTGPHLPEQQFGELSQAAPSNVKVVRRLEGLADHLRNAKISISQCGYNTAMDVLSVHGDSDCRAVFVPYDTQGQLEQIKRSQLLESAGFAINLPQSQLSDEKLSQAMNAAIELPKSAHKVDFRGVENSALMIRNWLLERMF